MAQIKTVLNDKQSQELLTLGIQPCQAYTWHLGNNPELRKEHLFNQDDLLRLLPPCVPDPIRPDTQDNYLKMERTRHGWRAGYFDQYEVPHECFEEPELIDALFELIKWVISKDWIGYLPEEW